MTTISPEMEKTEVPEDTIDMYPLGKPELEVKPANIDLINQGLEAIEPQVRQTAEISKRIGEVLHNPDRELSDLDRQKLEAIQKRIERSTIEAATDCAVGMNWYNRDTAKEVPGFFEFPIKLYSEIGEDGGWVQGPNRYDTFWVGSSEQAAEAAQTIEEQGRGDRWKGSEFDIGRTSETTKVEILRALGALRDGETIEQAVQRRNAETGSHFWDQDYHATFDTDIEGVTLSVNHQSKQRGRGEERSSAILEVKI